MTEYPKVPIATFLSAFPFNLTLLSFKTFFIHLQLLIIGEGAACFSRVFGFWFEVFDSKLSFQRDPFLVRPLH